MLLPWGQTVLRPAATSMSTCTSNPSGGGGKLNVLRPVADSSAGLNSPSVKLNTYMIIRGQQHLPFRLVPFAHACPHLYPYSRQTMAIKTPREVIIAKKRNLRSSSSLL